VRGFLVEVFPALGSLLVHGREVDFIHADAIEEVNFPANQISNFL
jgi:hypothetical protein